MFKPFCLVAALFVALSMSVPVAAADHDRARDAVRSGEIQPLGQIIGQVQSRYPGRLLDADLAKQGRDMVYRLRWLTSDGNVLKMTVDARNGRILGVQGRR